MGHGVFFLLVALVLLAMPLYASSSTPVGPIVVGSKTYYVVNGSNPNLNTGNQVCAAVGLQCVGYTNFDNSVCLRVHPNATSIYTLNGSKNGFYCNGPPQYGECGRHLNSCEVCQACGLNANCNTNVGDQYREMYVQCAKNASAAVANQTSATNQTYTYTTIYYSSKTSIFSGISSFFSSIFTGITSFFSNVFTGLSLFHTVTSNTTALIGPYPGYWGCTFFQYPWHGVNQKKVDCGVYKAADSFCVINLQSTYATSVYCNSTSGLIVCINPCNKGGQVIPSSCPYDAARPNGAQAPPTNWC